MITKKLLSVLAGACAIWTAAPSTMALHDAVPAVQEKTPPTPPTIPPDKKNPTKTQGKSEKAKSAKGASARAITGEVIAADATSITLRSKQGEVTLAVNADTKVVQRGKAISGYKLEPGDSVSVSYVRSGDTMVATRITLKKPSGSSKVAAPKKDKAPI